MTRNAASLPGELPHLRALVRNPASLPARTDYSNWLRSQGDKARSEFLEQLSIAFESMQESELPDFDSVPLDWARLTGAISLGQLLEDGKYNPVTYMSHSELTSAVERLFPFARPALNIEFEPSTEVGSVGHSRLWGEPDLPPDMKWPTLGSCLQPWPAAMDPESPCLFVGQINLADLSGTLAATEFPDVGLLSFFCHIDDENGGLSVNMTYTADVNSTTRRSPPSTLDESNSPLAAHRIRFTEALAFPYYDGPWEADLLVKEEDTGIDEGAYYALTEGGGASLLGLLGYFTSTTGGDPTPDKSIRKLGCVRVTPDAGIVHLGIPETDLLAGNFSAFTYPWFDWDL